MFSVPNKFRSFQIRLAKWFKKNGRNYSWRNTNDLYSFVLAELLLQKTNAEKVAPVYEGLIKKYPTSNSLVEANVNELLDEIRPLGLFNRVQTLQSAAAECNKLDEKTISYEALLNIKGIGPYIAASVSIHILGKKVGILDPNIIRIYERIFGIKSNLNRPRNDRKLVNVSRNLLPVKQPSRYIYALLDFGALVCKARRPLCSKCPMYLHPCTGITDKSTTV